MEYCKNYYLADIKYFCEFYQIEKIEQWLPIKNYDLTYHVSDLGRVKTLQREIINGKGVRFVRPKIMKSKLNKAGGYYCVNLSANNKRHTYFIHKLVAIAFLNHIPSGLTMVINHKDLNKENNALKNLEIITQRENTNLKHFSFTSKYVGVCWNKLKNKWVSVARANGKSNFLGYFTDEYEAHLAYQNFIDKL